MFKASTASMTFARRNLDRASRISTWFCVVLIVALSLVPGSERPTTGLTGGWEHLIAYAGAGLFATLAYHRLIWAIVGLSLLSFAMEYLQNFVPGRQPAILDAFISTAGGTAGAALAMFVTTAFQLVRGIFERLRPSIRPKGEFVPPSDQPASPRG
jgi:hypothetical protein